MATLPTSLTLLFDPPNFEDLCPHWAGTFAARRQFRLKGYNEFTRNRVPRLGKAELAALLPAALQAVPDAWRNQWPNGDWDSLRHDQYAFAGEAPLRFDKACLVIALTAVQLERSAPQSESVCDHVKICPAVFAVDGFDRNFYNTHVRNDVELYRALAVASGGQNRGFFGEVLSGQLMTYQTATGIEGKLLTLEMETGVYAFRHNNPSQPRKVPKPAMSERLIARLE